MECHTPIPQSRRTVDLENDQAGNESSYSIFPLVTSEGVAVSDSEKVENLADNLETQIQPVADPSVPPIIEMVDVVLRTYFQTFAREKT